MLFKTYIAHLANERLLSIVHILGGRVRQVLSSFRHAALSLQLFSNFEDLEGPHDGFRTAAERAHHAVVLGDGYGRVARAGRDLIDFVSERTLVFFELLDALLQVSHILHYLVCKGTN